MFTIADGRDRLYQWDTNVRLRLDETATDIDEAHFSTKFSREMLPVKVVRSEGEAYVTIPNILLQKSYDVIVYAYCCASGCTRDVEIFEVTPKAKPADYVYTETELLNYRALADRISRLEESGGVSDEQIAEAVDDYLSENPIEVGNVVKSVNGVKPDGAGNVEIPVGGGTAVASVEPAEDDIPKVFISGEKPGTKDDVLAEMQYISKTDNFHAYLEIKCQGTSSMAHAKKNFTVKLYDDEARETKLKKSFKDWKHNGNKYVLKANYIDHSHARNIVSARLWNEVVKSRPDYDYLPMEMRNSPRNGAVDGFPVKVYYNGFYEGIYTWNIGKEDWMWGMDKDNPNHVLLCAESNVSAANPCNFNALWNGVNETDWSVEVGTNSTALKNSLNNLIQFVMNNDGDAFRNGIGNYLDIQSAIDYYIFQYEICGLDGLAKNMLLASYDGTKWICGAYDMDSTFGMWWDGSKFVSATYACPEDYQANASLLWKRIEENYIPELKARQAELRKSVLSYSNMVTHFERFMDAVGLDLYAEDLTIYNAIPSGSTNNIQQIRDYIRKRMLYVNAQFASMTATEKIACTGIALSASTLSFKDFAPMTLTATVTPSNTTDAVLWTSGNDSIATVVNGVVTPVKDGSCTISATCGDYSATCVVSIDCSVPCTAVTLSESSLTFDGEGNKTLTVTVMPDNTTDKLIWESSNVAVATVVDGVVTAINNGECYITAKCGNVSASCSVSVSGFTSIDYTLDAFEGIKWTKGAEFNNTTGELKNAAQCWYSEKFELQNTRYTYYLSGISDHRTCVWDENDNFVGCFSSMTLLARTGYKYAVSLYDPTGTFIAENATCLPEQVATPIGTVSIDLSTLAWSKDGTQVKTDISTYVNASSKLQNASHIVAFAYSTKQTRYGDELIFVFHQNKELMVPTITVDEITAYLAENPTTLVFNR